MVAATSIIPSKKSQEALIQYYRSAQMLQNISRLDMRSRLERVDRQYMREVDLTDEQQRAKRANRTGDTNRIQNITVPVVMPQVEAAVTHQASVYLDDYPLFGVVSAPEFIDEALQLETTIEDNSIRGGWARELIMFFRDGYKYNFAPLEVAWGTEVTYSVDTNIQENIKEGVPKEVIWSGNKVKRLDPYNTFVDTRVPPSEVYKKGEFAGFTEFMSRIELKMFISQLPDKIIANIVPAFESGLGTTSGAGTKDASSWSFYVPNINPDIIDENLLSTGTNWLAWAGLTTGRELKIDYKDGYEVTTLYARLLPSEFDLRVPNRNTPQIYKLIIVNHQHIIYAELQTNAHNYLPILIGQPLEDGLDYQTKSLADNGEPFQQLASAYMNSITASRRRAISDRVLYDPSRVTKAHINSENPSAKIPVRPAAYGKNIGDSVFQFPYREDQASFSMQQIASLLDLSDKLSGQNKVDQGQFVKGNKTNEQFAATQSASSGRDTLASIMLEYQCFIPLKHILKTNILQFQGGASIYNREKDVVVEIDPVALRQAVLEFKISDGLTSKERLLKPEAFSVAMQVFGSSPEIAAGYNVPQFFSYIMKTQGAKISAFEKSPEQQAFEQALNSWQQIAQTIAEKGDKEAIASIPPQPNPADFGYDPTANKPTPKGTTVAQGNAPSPINQAGQQ